MSKTRVQPAIQFRPIGVIRTDFPDRFAIPRQGNLCPMSQGRIEIRRDLNPRALTEGLTEFSHLWLLWVFSRNPPHVQRAKTKPPRLGGKSVGLLASRSPMRPCPIGLTLASLERVDEQGRIHLRGVDLLDQTPILDIKPYIGADRPELFDLGWTSEHAERSKKVKWTDQAWEVVESSTKTAASADRVKRVIEDSLSLDPRPIAFKKWSEKGKEVQHRAKLAGFDVVFAYTKNDEIEILSALASD